jgi:hypothetical protein
MAKKTKASGYVKVQAEVKVKVHNFNVPSMFGAKVNPNAVFANPIVLPCTKKTKTYRKARSSV